MEPLTRVQILDKVVFVKPRFHALGKDRNPYLFFFQMSRLGSLALAREPIEEN